MKIAVGTASPLKLRSVEAALKALQVEAEIVSVETISGVPEQPIGYEEIIEGATNRAKAAMSETDADLSIGIESGAVEIRLQLDQYFDIPAVCVLARDGSQSFAFGAGYFVPDWMIEEITDRGIDLGALIKELDPKAEKDPISYFSEGTVRREELLTQAIVCALVRTLHKDRYQPRAS